MCCVRTRAELIKCVRYTQISRKKENNVNIFFWFLSHRYNAKEITNQPTNQANISGVINILSLSLSLNHKPLKDTQQITLEWSLCAWNMWQLLYDVSAVATNAYTRSSCPLARSLLSKHMSEYFDQVAIFLVSCSRPALKRERYAITDACQSGSLAFWFLLDGLIGSLPYRT